MKIFARQFSMNLVHHEQQLYGLWRDFAHLHSFRNINRSLLGKIILIS